MLVHAQSPEGNINILFNCSNLFPERRSLACLELASFASLASQLALEDPLSLPPEHWVLPDFYVSEEFKLRFLQLTPKVLLTGPSLYPSLCFYEISYMLKF